MACTSHITYLCKTAASLQAVWHHSHAENTLTFQSYLQRPPQPLLSSYGQVHAQRFGLLASRGVDAVLCKADDVIEALGALASLSTDSALRCKASGCTRRAVRPYARCKMVHLPPTYLTLCSIKMILLRRHLTCKFSVFQILSFHYWLFQCLGF